MLTVGWILKIYANLVKTNEAENDWNEYFMFQENVLQQINK